MLIFVLAFALFLIVVLFLFVLVLYLERVARQLGDDLALALEVAPRVDDDTARDLERTMLVV